MSEPPQQTYTQRASAEYQKQKDAWLPWIEDLYLRWFTKDNKASYATKDTLDKTKVTHIDQVDALQDDANSLVAGQLGTGGLAQPAGDWVSKEGVNRAERRGKDEKGGYLPSGVKSAGEGVKSAGGLLGGVLGKKGGNEDEGKR